MTGQSTGSPVRRLRLMLNLPLFSDAGAESDRKPGTCIMRLRRTTMPTKRTRREFIATGASAAVGFSLVPTPGLKAVSEIDLVIRNGTIR